MPGPDGEYKGFIYEMLPLKEMLQWCLLKLEPGFTGIVNPLSDEACKGVAFIPRSFILNHS